MVFFMDISKISYNDHTLFHMLRHFEWINESARKCLLERGYSNTKIDSNLAMPGSKFHSSFATDIKSLLLQCIGKENLQSTSKHKYFEMLLSFDASHFKNGIGTIGVYSKYELINLGCTDSYLKMNRDQLLWHAIVNEMPTTVQLTIVIKKQASADFLITAFPGVPTMPIPNSKMNKELLNESKKFWDENVFLEEKK
jgi:hypothetical protein